MSDSQTQTPSVVRGQCLCGQVAAEVSVPFNRFFQCYCNRCRKKSGGAFAALLFTSADSLKWLKGEELVKRFDLPEAEVFSTAFCSNCGSPVPFLSRRPGVLSVPAGFLDDDPMIRPEANIFTEETVCWFEEGQQAPRFDQYPITPK